MIMLTAALRVWPDNPAEQGKFHRNARFSSVKWRFQEPTPAILVIFQRHPQAKDAIHED
jgi:hypothetical protein